MRKTELCGVAHPHSVTVTGQSVSTLLCDIEISDGARNHDGDHHGRVLIGTPTGDVQIIADWANDCRETIAFGEGVFTCDLPNQHDLDHSATVEFDDGRKIVASWPKEYVR